MAEFCDPETFQVILVNTPDDFKIFTLEELLTGGIHKAGYYKSHRERIVKYIRKT